MTTVTIYTDGACSGNPGPGGWGAVLSDGKQEKEISGGEPDTTNNRMELMAAIMALEALKRPLKVILYTDSKYVQKGISEWLPGWKAKGWRNSQGKPVKNVDLWLRLEAASVEHQVDWRLLEGGVPTARNRHGGHGQGSVPTKVPEHLVAYVLHMTAASIVFLVQAEKELR